jgi:hypothetical protein
MTSNPRHRRPRRFLVTFLATATALSTVAAVTPVAPAQADGLAGWAAGQLLSGAGSGAASAVLGTLMAQAGLDPTTNALKEIDSKLTQISQQITSLQATANVTLTTLLKSTFDIRIDALQITKIKLLEDDIACWGDAARPLRERVGCRDNFRTNAVPSDLNSVVGVYNDLLDGVSTTVVQAYARSLAGATRFYTQADQQQVIDLYTYLDDLQVAATVEYAEAVNLAAVNNDTDRETALANAEHERDAVDKNRADQAQRNPVSQIPGALDLTQRFWIYPTAFGPLQHAGSEKYRDRWRLPTTDEFASLASGRGNMTVKAYLSHDAGLETGLRNVPEYGDSGEFWTSTRYKNPFFAFIANPCSNCYETVSANDAQVRAHPETQQFYVLFVSPLTEAETKHYGFLWN